MKKVEKVEKMEKVEKVEKETGKASTAADEKAAAGREGGAGGGREEGGAGGRREGRGVPVAAEREIEEMDPPPDEPVLSFLRTLNCIVRPP